MSAIDLAGFNAKFAADVDPWSTFSSRDEAVKRDAIIKGLRGRRFGRVLELASGNGSNSVALAAHALRLDATEGTESGTALTARALAGAPNARALCLSLPAPFPRPLYDAIIVAELLYYLKPHAMHRLAIDVCRGLRPGGTLVVAHHRIDFHDFAQHAADIHDRFLAASGSSWSRRVVRRNSRWIVESATRN